VRTNTASGRASVNPGRRKPWPPPAIAKPVSCSDTETASAPSAVKARFSRRVCQSASSTKIATLGRGIAEGLVDQGLVESAAVEGAAAVERRDGDAGRAEQQPVHGIEIALVGIEDLRERPAVVARAGARQVLGQLLGIAVRAGDEELHR